MEGIPDEWGTAVSVMAMVFGNMGDTSATGVCFSRDAGNGENLFNGEYLVNAQGEDVVAGIRTPQQITKIGSQRWAERAGISEAERVAKYPSMEEAMPEIYKQLDQIQDTLEHHYHDMQDMEFTVQEAYFLPFTLLYSFLDYNSEKHFFRFLFRVTDIFKFKACLNEIPQSR